MQFGMLSNVLLEVLVTARPSAVSGGAVEGAGAQSSACFWLSGVYLLFFLLGGCILA